MRHETHDYRQSMRGIRRAVERGEDIPLPEFLIRRVNQSLLKLGVSVEKLQSIRSL